MPLTKEELLVRLLIHVLVVDGDRDSLSDMPDPHGSMWSDVRARGN